jgi:hypothetical protein
MSNELSSSHAGGSASPIPAEEIKGLPAGADILMASDKSKGERPMFFNDVAVERVMNISMALATELAVLRERLDSMERLLESKGVLKQAEIEAFEPNDEAAEERQLWHARYSARILRFIKQEIDAIAHPENNQPMQQIADDINEM